MYVKQNNKEIKIERCKLIIPSKMHSKTDIINTVRRKRPKVSSFVYEEQLDEVIKLCSNTSLHDIVHNNRILHTKLELEIVFKNNENSGFSKNKSISQLHTIIDDFNKHTAIINSLKVLPYWYKIPEYDINKFMSYIKSLYDIYENKKIYKSEIDLFGIEGSASFYEMTIDDIIKKREIEQKDRALAMARGLFHQNLMFGFNGWENFKSGHITGCDGGTKDGTIICEVKNNINTMNSSSLTSVINKLKKQIELGKQAILVIVNGDIKPKIDINGIKWISGKDFYTELSGRNDFWDSLLDTYKYLLKNFKTYNSIIEHLKTS